MVQRGPLDEGATCAAKDVAEATAARAHAARLKVVSAREIEARHELLSMTEAAGAAMVYAETVRLAAAVTDLATAEDKKKQLGSPKGTYEALLWLEGLVRTRTFEHLRSVRLASIVCLVLVETGFVR